MRSQPRTAMKGKTAVCLGFSKKECGVCSCDGMVAMLGVPMHSVEIYISFAKTG